MLLQARALVEDVMGRHRSLRDEQSVALVESAGHRVADAARDLAAGARDFIGVVLPGHGATDFMPAPHILTRAAVAGVEVKILAAADVLDDPDALARLDDVVRRCEVRLVPVALEEALLVDDVSALIRHQHGDEGGACLVRAPALLGSLRCLFRASWQGGAALAGHPRADGRSHTALGRRVLRALGSGVTDEAAARTLGMSVRTYRRNVADIAHELGARSRFQIGLRAAELGLLRQSDIIAD
ncbi:hypothetical protein [Micromonospora sp. NBS 11-29]|uniref:hypothetical protein n=1 Tax=Micromonospora sp. NBS 11-29 TaxID=1960879 RepID=UPI000B799012|nr:hypothetical protein [Micromonospora sp. NBS 11-29]